MRTGTAANLPSIAGTESKIRGYRRIATYRGGDLDRVFEEERRMPRKAALSGGPAYLGISDHGVHLELLESMWKEEPQLAEYVDHVIHATYII